MPGARTLVHMDLLTIFLALLVIALAVWAVPKLVAAFGIPDPMATVIYVGLVVLVVLWFVSLLGGPTFLRLR